MKSALRTTVTAAVGTALAVSTGTFVPVSTAVAAPAAISCDTDAGGDSGFYDGASAGEVYNGKFERGPGIPGLGSYVPQGLTTWKDWDGGKDLLLITEYGPDGKHARIYGVDPATGAHVGTVNIAESHVGGIAVSRGWVFVSGRQTGDGGHTLRKYKTSEVAQAIKADDGKVLAQTGEARKVYGASFLAADGNTLYSGKFNDSGRDSMYAYAVAADGTLTTGTKYEVPTKTQGLSVAAGHFFYSTSYGRQYRGNIYVVDEGATDIDVASTKCFRAPSLTEGITDHDGTTYLLFESGADEYADTACSGGAPDPCTRNVIANLHTATTSALPDF